MLSPCYGGLFMVQPVLDDALWSLIEPQLPPSVARPKGGRPPLDNRKVLIGIIFVLKTGIPWEYLPQELGCGSGDDLLASAAGLAASRGLEERPPYSVEPTTGRQPDRRVSGGDR